MSIKGIAACDEARHAAHRAECFERFNEAVRAGQRGSYTLGRTYIAELRGRLGDGVADLALKELRGCVAEWKSAR